MLIILSLILSLPLSAQEEKTPFSRKGRILIEAGTDILGGLGGGRTGSSTIFVGLLTGGGFTSTSFLAGGKYYIIGRVPVELGLGFVTFGDGGGSAFLGNASVGYAIPLAKNINLEPFLGILFADGGSIGQFGIGFSMFL